MKVSKSWLKELVNLKAPIDEVLRLLPLRTIGVKEVTPEYFELDMKGYNRADLLSMRGTAYEISAITDSEVSFQENTEYIWKKSEFGKVEIEVEDANLAPVYCLAKIEGLKVSQSPADWVKKLNDSGMRSVNNIADVTNLIMLEYGQPLHSFDADTVKSGKIIVRRAKEGEEIVTLDSKKRKLETTDLLITDPEKALGIAGVMGGKNSEVSDSTSTILLEAAIFDPVNLRQTATRLNLRSEASKRFQHGLTKKRCLQAFDAAIRMYESLGGKVTAVTLKGNLEDKERRVSLTRKRLDTIIGIEIKPEDAENYLKKLAFTLASQGEALRAWEVIPPYWRLDIEIEDDVIEEVARMYGYEKLPAKELGGEIPEKIDQSFYERVYKIKTTLVNLGFTEIQTYSFYSTKVISSFQFPASSLIRIANPMSAETEYMRNNLWPNLLEAVAKNIRNGIKDVAIFEIGKVYWPEGEKPKEGYHLAIALSNETDNPLAELSVVADSLPLVIERSKATKQSSPDQSQIQIATLPSVARNDSFVNKDWFHPARFAVLEKDGKQTGYIAEIHQRFTDKFGINQRVAILEIEL